MKQSPGKTKRDGISGSHFKSQAELNEMESLGDISKVKQPTP